MAQLKNLSNIGTLCSDLVEGVEVFSRRKTSMVGITVPSHSSSLRFERGRKNGV